MGSVRCIELGRLLHDCRTKQGVALEVIAERTRTNLSYLQAIEDGELDRLPASCVFVKGYLRSYSRCLRLEDPGLDLQIDEVAAEVPHVPRAPRTVVDEMKQRNHRLRLWRLLRVLFPGVAKHQTSSVPSDLLSPDPSAQVRA